jgi:hypothetical protein
MDSLLNFYSYPPAFGSEISLHWNLPAALPADYSIYLFKKKAGVITDDEINSFFATNVLNNAEVIQLKPGTIGFYDSEVVNDCKYYYKAIIRDPETGEISPSVFAENTAHPQLTVNIKDGKNIVTKAIKLLLTSVYNAEGENIKLDKDVKVIKNFSLDSLTENIIFVERVNGSNYAQFLGNVYAQYQSEVTLGSIDVDVVRMTFLTEGSPDRRDTMLNIFRAYKFFLTRAIKKMGALTCEITIEGDYYNPAVHGSAATGFQVIFSMLMSNKLTYNLEELNVILGNIQVIK